MTDPWKCFHCGDVFHSEITAREHFGSHEGLTPLCLIKASEGGLVRALREAEGEAERWLSECHNEGAEGLKAWRAAQSRQVRALNAMEQTGYERGLRDMAASVERLRRILARYGDRVPMAMCHRPDWQQEIDEAMRFVADNPEIEA